MKRILLVLITILSLSNSKAQNEGNVFFGTTTVHDIYLQFYQTNYWDSLEAAYTGDYYISGDITIDGTVLTNCGVRFKGNSSYNNPSIKKSWKLDLNEFVTGQDYDGLKKLNLNNCFKDPTFLREKLMNDFLRDNGLLAPRTHFARIYLNGTLWGLYTVVEEVDVKDFLMNNIGDNAGNEFKGDPSGDLQWFGSTPSSYYTKYELKTNETLNDWTDLVNFINVLNNTSSATLQTQLDAVFDTDSYFYVWATHSLFANLDSYLGSGHNYYIYHDSTDNKFKFITWDTNEAFGNFNQGMTITQLEQLTMFYAPSNRPLHAKTLAVSAYQQKLVDAFCVLAGTKFTNAEMDPKIDSLSNLIRTDVYADPNKFFTNQNFEDNLANNITVVGTPGGNNLPGLKSFITNRRNFIQTEIAAYGCNLGIDDNETMALDLWPNPATDKLNITGISNPADHSIKIFNVLGEVIYSAPFSNEIDLAEIHETGIFFLEIKNNATNALYVVKFLKI